MSSINVIVSFAEQSKNPFLESDTFRNQVCASVGILPAAPKVTTKYGKKNHTASVVFHFAYPASAEKLADKARKAFKNKAQVTVIK